MFELTCYDNQLVILDISKNTALIGLFCSNNKLTNLDVGQNTVLSRLYCDNNQLTTLDVSKNIRLEQLSCKGNKITTLDLSNCPIINKNRYQYHTVEYDVGDVSVIWASTASTSSVSSTPTATTPPSAPSLIIATLPAFQASRSGEYQFDVSLDRTAPLGSTLSFLSLSKDLEAVFTNDNGEEITMPTTESLDRVKVSANFELGATYSPVIAATPEETLSTGGGCNAGIFSAIILLAGLIARKK